MVHGLSRCGSRAPGHVGSAVVACGVSVPDQELNLPLLHCKADFQPLDHQGSPYQIDFTF